MPTTLRLVLLLMLGLVGLQPVGYGYDVSGVFVSGIQNIVPISPEIGAVIAESVPSLLLNFNREGSTSDKRAQMRQFSNFVAAESGATLRLPASMSDELATYQQAADNGLLTKIRSSDLPASNARAIWEEANGPVTDGFDVDHIIQRQFGGTDDLSNLQLKLSGLNRSQGAQAMWLNKAAPYGTMFDSVELIGP